MYEWLRDCLIYYNHGVMNREQDVVNSELKKLDTSDDSCTTPQETSDTLREIPEKVKLRCLWCHSATGFVAPTFPGDLLPGPQET